MKLSPFTHVNAIGAKSWSILERGWQFGCVMQYGAFEHIPLDSQNYHSGRTLEVNDLECKPPMFSYVKGGKLGHVSLMTKVLIPAHHDVDPSA